MAITDILKTSKYTIAASGNATHTFDTTMWRALMESNNPNQNSGLETVVELEGAGEANFWLPAGASSGGSPAGAGALEILDRNLAGLTVNFFNDSSSQKTVHVLEQLGLGC